MSKAKTRKFPLIVAAIALLAIATSAFAGPTASEGPAMVNQFRERTSEIAASPRQDWGNPAALERTQAALEEARALLAKIETWVNDMTAKRDALTKDYFNRLKQLSARLEEIGKNATDSDTMATARVTAENEVGRFAETLAKDLRASLEARDYIPRHVRAVIDSFETITSNATSGKPPKNTLRVRLQRLTRSGDQRLVTKVFPEIDKLSNDLTTIIDSDRTSIVDELETTRQSVEQLRSNLKLAEVVYRSLADSIPQSAMEEHLRRSVDRVIDEVNRRRALVLTAADADRAQAISLESAAWVAVEVPALQARIESAKSSGSLSDSAAAKLKASLDPDAISATFDSWMTTEKAQAITCLKLFSNAP